MENIATNHPLAEAVDVHIYIHSHRYKYKILISCRVFFWSWIQMFFLTFWVLIVRHNLLIFLHLQSQNIRFMPPNPCHLCPNFKFFSNNINANQWVDFHNCIAYSMCVSQYTQNSWIFRVHKNWWIGRCVDTRRDFWKIGVIENWK